LETRSIDGRQISYPLGKDVVGYIMYNEDGYMFVAITRPNRAKFAAGDLLGGSTEEKVQAATSYVSYCGRYEFRGDIVIHHVELSLFPNWVGSDQERLVELTGNRLTLSTRPILLEGKQQTAHLIWERVRTLSHQRFVMLLTHLAPSVPGPFSWKTYARVCASMSPRSTSVQAAVGAV
jgi:hypothetical protein